VLARKTEDLARRCVSVKSRGGTESHDRVRGSDLRMAPRRRKGSSTATSSRAAPAASFFFESARQRDTGVPSSALSLAVAD
jgi:hypothetical protein